MANWPKWPDGAPPRPSGGGIPWGPIIGTVGSVAGGIIDKASQDATNKANAQNVDKQIAFQENQNATAYQRAVADIKAAGLNPALAYKQGGADSGQGAASENRAVMHSQRLREAVAAYNDFANGSAERQLLREQANATYAQARKTTMEGTALQPEAWIATDTSEGGWLDTYRKARIAKGRADISLAPITVEQAQHNVNQTKQNINTAKAQENLMRTQSTLNEQEFQNAWFRKNIAPWINSTAKAMDGIGQVSRGAKGLGLTPFTKFY